MVAIPTLLPFATRAGLLVPERLRPPAGPRYLLRMTLGQPSAFRRRVTRGLRFGPWILDTSSGELGRDGRWMQLQEQPLELLLILAGRAGEVVPREEIEQRLWPRTFVDFEHGLNAAVKRLRAAIGDSAARPRFIETLPRRGYRFIANVEPVETDT
jgi:DNA-binding winged helix-turn-helix (wHTH) protein